MKRIAEEKTRKVSSICKEEGSAVCRKTKTVMTYSYFELFVALLSVGMLGLVCLFLDPFHFHFSDLL